MGNWGQALNFKRLCQSTGRQKGANLGERGSEPSLHSTCCSWNPGIPGVDNVGCEACNRVGNLVTIWVVVLMALKGLGVT